MSDEKDPSLITVKEFKMWLQGVEEMQPDGWSPDQRQWAKIRAKIDIITEAESIEPVPAKYATPYIAPRFGPDAAPSNAGAQPVTAPVMPRALPVQPTQLAGPFASGDGQTPVKTPNIDTGVGKPYESSFA